MDSVKDKVVLITGASSGIGAATAVLFAKYGSRLALTDRNNLEKVAQECAQQGLSPEKIVLITADLSKDEDVKRIAEETMSFFNTLHILVNNAGMLQIGTIQQTSMDDYDYIMNVNVRAAVQLTKFALPYLKKNKGSVVNVSSAISTRGRVEKGVCSMAKAALDMFTSVLSLELGPAGVRVNSVNPGVIRTPMIDALVEGDPEQFYAKLGKHYPLQRVGTKEEVAQTIVFLASDAASFITGANLPVDGGVSKTASWFLQETDALLASESQK